MTLKELCKERNLKYIESKKKSDLQKITIENKENPKLYISFYKDLKHICLGENGINLEDLYLINLAVDELGWRD